MAKWIPALVALGLTAALGVSHLLGYLPVAVAAGVVVVAIAYGWPRLTDSPQPRITSAVLLAFGLLGMVTVWLIPSVPLLEWLPILAGMGLLWSFVQNLVRGIEASHAVANVAAQVAGIVVALAAASWVAGYRIPGDREAVVVGLVAIILAQIATSLPWPARYTSPLAVVVAVLGAGAATVLYVGGGLHLLPGLLLGGVLGLLVAAVDRMLGLIADSRFQAEHLAGSLTFEYAKAKARRAAVHLTIGAAPVALGGIVVYVIGRIFV
ncbi:ammonia permease [Brevibacterium litoralis]|uniref:ammonia permease n=1 Tax=Brevibacterium litoralis TaxID=3138935 RepID=UPI0032EB0195